MTDLDRQKLPDQFEQAAAPPRRAVTIEIDADVLQWIEAEGGNLAAEVNGLLRFVMDTTQQKAAEFDPAAWEPGEMQEPAPAHTL